MMNQRENAFVGENLLLLTDHYYEDVEKEELHIQIRPVYEWCAEMEQCL